MSTQNTPTSSRLNLAAFVALALAVLLVITSLATVIFKSRTDRAIADAYDDRYNAYLLADQLRQSSDDLTRLVRTYATTGESRYADYFQTVLDIRNGDVPRPERYDAIYWDYVTATDSYPRPSGPPASLDSLMADAGFTPEELNLFLESERQSNELVTIENSAMSLMGQVSFPPEGNITDDITGAQRQAIAMLHGGQYHDAKVKIMDPLERLFESIDERTTTEIDRLVDRQSMMLYAIEGQLGVAFLLLAFVLFTAIRRMRAS